jgi:hypothetical protein
LHPKPIELGEGVNETENKKATGRKDHPVALPTFTLSPKGFRQIMALALYDGNHNGALSTTSNVHLTYLHTKV